MTTPDGSTRLDETEPASGLALSPRSTPALAYDETELPGEGSGPSAGPPATLSSAPPRIGRYVVLEALGEGGMGVVVAAYDPQLDRRVAVKLVRGAAPGEDADRRRIEREARSMAKLSHPNVLAIYEVGEHEGQLFLSMELVRGKDLKHWLQEHGERAEWREILDLFLQAGRGLAAAHGAGLVHRDFKPANVLVGDDGRVRVADFGLAHQRVDDDPETAKTRASAGDTRVGASGDDATIEADRVEGTPAYMAPETFSAGITDAASDQFSFSVALWEALHGQHPFAGGSLVEVIMHRVRGTRVAPPPGRAVPTWLRRVLDRGLSLEPGDRYPTLEAMLAALAADPTRRRRRIAAGVAACLAIGGWFALERHLEARQIAACEADGAGVSAFWNPEIEARLRANLRATGVSYAETTIERVIHHFDAQARAWRAARTEVCLDARVREASTEEALDRATSCLDERRMEMEARIDEIAGADGSTAQYAVEGAASLSPVSPCRDAQRLARLPQPPQDRARVREILRAFSSANALRSAGRYEEGVVVARAAIDDADALAWPPLVAAAHLTSGTLLSQSTSPAAAEPELELAYFEAAASGAVDVAAKAAMRLTFNVGHQQARHAEGIRWSRHAEVALTLLGAGEGSFERAEAVANLGLVHLSAGDYSAAKECFERARAIDEETLGAAHPSVAVDLNNLAVLHETMGAYEEAWALSREVLALREASLGADHPHVALALNNLAVLRESMGDYPAARALHEQALAIRRRALPAAHPDVAETLNNLATVHDEMGDYAAAEALYEEARVILEKALGADHPKVAVTFNNLGNVHVHIGDHEEAIALYQRALAIQERTLGEDHPNLATTLNNLAKAHQTTGSFAEAKALHERALAIKERALGPEHPSIATSLNNLASVDLAFHEYAEAKACYERSLAIREAALGVDHLDVAVPLVGLARVALAEGRPADAVPLAARALQIREASATPIERLAEARFVLAQALWDAPAAPPQDRPQALLLAREAADALRDAKGQEKDFAATREWLDAHATRGRTTRSRP